MMLAVAGGRIIGNGKVRVKKMIFESKKQSIGLNWKELKQKEDSESGPKIFNGKGENHR